ncbi:hypothetical protein F5Y06DRAFT_106769 [Hypoxylon sp. FL0890]|nr:hypothetical protein F5Y06DRAFT_106769 [Hypoxylon sp. FL0890]
MSFGFAVGDVIAVLGLFERISVELRNYKNAPAHFQQLGAELDLLRSTLQHVLHLSPETETERQTLERIRAIALHCLQPLQTLADTMQAKEGSLGHFRTTRSLSNIGTRLHWSMVAQKDVDEFRKIILSEMVAINILLSEQQLYNIKRMSSISRESDSRILKQIDIHSDILMKQTSLILGFVSATPDTIADLRSIIAAQAKQQSQQMKTQSQDSATMKSQLETISSGVLASSATVRDYTSELGRAAKKLSRLMKDIKKLFIFLSTCTKEMLEAISRNTRALLDFSRQMKRIAQAMETIPLHLNVDIIRFDDAWGGTWGLPLQACGTWSAFKDLLQNVVFANRRGADLVANEQYAITPPNSAQRTAQRIYPENWRAVIKAGMHIEQYIFLRVISHTEKNCPKPGCTGSIEVSPAKRIVKVCSRCRQFVASLFPHPIVLSPGRWKEAIYRRQAQVANEVPHFRRIHVYQLINHVYDNQEAPKLGKGNGGSPDYDFEKSRKTINERLIGKNITWSMPLDVF